MENNSDTIEKTSIMKYNVIAKIKEIATECDLELDSEIKIDNIYCSSWEVEHNKIRAYNYKIRIKCDIKCDRHNDNLKNIIKIRKMCGELHKYIIDEYATFQFYVLDTKETVIYSCFGGFMINNFLEIVYEKDPNAINKNHKNKEIIEAIFF